MPLEIGGIYILDYDKRPVRIIGLDEYEVFFDSLWSDNSWTFSGNFKKKCFFYRASREFFEYRSKKLSHLPLSEEEFKIFRPDLLMRTGRTLTLQWNKLKFKNFDSLYNYLCENLGEEFNNEIVHANKIVLIPIGPKGGLKRGNIIQTDNGMYFTPAELIWKAKNMLLVVISNGIGIYRIGFEASHLITLVNILIRPRL